MERRRGAGRSWQAGLIAGFDRWLTLVLPSMRFEAPNVEPPEDEAWTEPMIGGCGSDDCGRRDGETRQEGVHCRWVAPKHGGTLGNGRRARAAREEATAGAAMTTDGGVVATAAVHAMHPRELVGAEDGARRMVRVPVRIRTCGVGGAGGCPSHHCSQRRKGTTELGPPNRP